LLDGTIDLGPYGRVPVAYKTLPDIQTFLAQVVQAKDKKPTPVEVRLSAKPVSKIYYVLGDVNTPGAYPLDGRETVLDGIIAAGGLSGKADHDNVILSRPSGPCECRTVLPICYDEIVQWGDATTNYQLMPGDRIYVSTKSFSARLFGGHRRKVCPPCGGSPTPCQVPEERCNQSACGVLSTSSRVAHAPASTSIVEARSEAPTGVPERLPATVTRDASTIAPASAASSR
jgi:hypothetical protein